MKQKTGVKFTRKSLYVRRVGVKVKGEGKKITSTEVRMRGRVSCRPRVGEWRRVVHFGRKGVDFGVKVVLFSSSRQGGGRGGRKVGQRPAARWGNGRSACRRGHHPDRPRRGERDSAPRSKMTGGERRFCIFCDFEEFAPLSLKMSGLCVPLRGLRSASRKVFGQRLSHFAPFDCIGQCSPAVHRPAKTSWISS